MDKITSIFSSWHGLLTVGTIALAIIQAVTPFLSTSAAGIAGSIAAILIALTHPTSTPTIGSKV